MKQKKIFQIGEKPLTIDDVFFISQERNCSVKLSPLAKKKMLCSFNYLQRRTQAGDKIYGVNTGFGILSNVQIPAKDLETLQLNLLRSHAVGMGPPLKEEMVRAMILLRAIALSKGSSGIRPVVVEGLLNLLNQGIHPFIPEQGSVGASGDLAPLAHLALALIGEGQVFYQGKLVQAQFALNKCGLKSIRLGPKEGLSLINGTQFMTAHAVFAVKHAEYLCHFSDVSGAMSLEALRGTDAAFNEKIHLVRPHQGQKIVAKRMRKFLNPKSKISKSHIECNRVQDPYSLRCIPQVHGASRDVIEYVKRIVNIEINSVTDNPLVFTDKSGLQGVVLSGGNFHGQYISMAMDQLAIACAELGSISEQRIEKLINPAISDLPAFLVKDSGLNSGFMILQVAAASIVSENKTLSHPASVDTIPTSADKEDHVSMGAWASRKALMVVNNLRRVLAIELMAATQGIDLLAPLRTTPFLEQVKKMVREKVKYLDRDRYLHPDQMALEECLMEFRFPVDC